MVEPHPGHNLEILAYAATMILILIGISLFVKLVVRFDKSTHRQPGGSVGGNRAQRRFERRGNRNRQR